MSSLARLATLRDAIVSARLDPSSTDRTTLAALMLRHNYTDDDITYATLAAALELRERAAEPAPTITYSDGLDWADLIPD